MKVKVAKETVERLISLLETFDADTEQFLNELPTPEKYSILAMALIVRGGYEDFEIVYDDATHTVSANDLTQCLLDFQFLNCHLRDAVQLKWSHFEQVWTNEEEDEE